VNVRTAAGRRQAERLRHAVAARRAFYDRGERAWQQYKRDGIACTVDAVSGAIDALADARRREITCQSAQNSPKAPAVSRPLPHPSLRTG
jgi:hypothetical protein